jgi:predicted enzyme related to lactoylglutathione lyase
MTDVRTPSAPAQTEQVGNDAGPRGAFIWYELMTPDPHGAKSFYDAVVGWAIGEGVPEFNGYRMIGRSDGGLAGGVLPLTDEMQQHGARPTWLGYVGVEDVDRAVGSIEQAGGKTLMPASDIPTVGRIAMVADPQGAPFYVMKPIPPEGRENEPSDVFSASEDQRVGWNELQTGDVEAARRFYGEQFGWDSDDYMDMGEMGLYRFWDSNGTRIGALFGAGDGEPSRWRFYFRVPSIAAARQAVQANGGAIHMGPHQVPSGEYVVIGSDPQGAEFALVGGA